MDDNHEKSQFLPSCWVMEAFSVRDVSLTSVFLGQGIFLYLILEKEIKTYIR